MRPRSWKSVSDWNAADATPGARADELLRRAHALPRAQQRAVWAWQPDARRLAAWFERQASSRAPLAGVPYALKDLFALVGTRTRAGAALPDRLAPVATEDAALVKALASAGAVCAGKTHLHEFAYGLTGENATYGDCTVPGYRARTSGGSSSGSAVAVAAGIVPFALGTDTGGSMRVPAAFCGLHSLRLTPAHTFIRDAFPLSPSFDTPGWFAKTRAELDLVTTALLGKPRRAATRQPRGVFLDFTALGQPARDDVRAAFGRFARAQAAPADVEIARSFREVCRGATDAYATLNSREAFLFHEPWLRLRPSFYSPEVKARIARGAKWTETDLASAESRRTAISDWFRAFFRTHDFLLLPATPFPALQKSECTLRNRLRLLDLMTPASLAGLPVRTEPIRLPSGLHTAAQIITKDLTTVGLV
ncbi:amidase family protein [Nibricoccus sp. IMCC34717]|uniref:amidase family protein n=1 Tax=Nibricoccus sp. IMCC34717 TaxID=3034021 RepID=UPI00384B35C7